MKYLKKNLRSQHIQAQDLLNFFRQLSSLMASGINLMKSLDILQQAHDKPRFRSVIQKLILDLESGESFHRCLERQAGHFDPFCCQLIRIGEKTGTLDLMLKKITAYKEKDQALNSQMKQALFYPAIVFLFTLATSLILLLLVVPQFAVLFQHFPNKIPLPTQIIIQLSVWLQKVGPSLGLLVIFALFILFRARKSLRLHLRGQDLICRLPLLHNLFIKISLARFSRYLGIILAAGIPLSEALLMLSPLFKLEEFRRSILKVHTGVHTGKNFYISLQFNPIFPPLLTQMVRTGEESGRLDLMLDKCADIYEAELEQRMQTLRLLLEPLIIAILGVLIGIVVIAMYLPIFRLGTAI